MPFKFKLKNWLILGLCLVFVIQTTLICPIVSADTLNNHTSQIPEGYTALTSKEQLLLVKKNLSGKYILMNDINFSDDDFVMGGAFYNSNNGFPCLGDFSGIFDGNGYSINNIEIHVNLFSSNTNCIKNLTVTFKNYENSIDESFDFCGLVGRNDRTIENCTFKGDLSFNINDDDIFLSSVCNTNYGTVTNCENFVNFEINTNSSDSFVGGIAYQNFGKVQNCYNKGNINLDIKNKSTTAQIGGVTALSGTVEKSASYGSITLTGICGEAQIGGISALGGVISDCLNIGNITLSGKFGGYVGGIAGVLWNRNSTISNSCNYGELTALTGVCVGGISGQNASKITDCYNNGALSGSQVGGISGDAIALVNNCINLNIGLLAATDFISYNSKNIQNCYFLSQPYTSTTTIYAGLKGLDSEQINKPESYTELDFNGVWDFYNNLPYIKTIDVGNKIDFESDTVDILVGDKTQNKITTFVYPYSDLTYISKHAEILTVSTSGEIEGKKIGTTVVTATDNLSGVSGSFNVVVDISSKDYLTGDTNDDKTINIKDLIRIKKVTSQRTDEFSKMNADFDGNGMIDAIDLEIMQKVLLDVSVDTIKDTQSTVSSLETNNLINPVGLDKAPEFSWILSSETRAKNQSAYQIMVSTSAEKLQNNEFDVWNSGKVVSGNTLGITYEGISLKPSTTYFWKVKLWDNEGRYSESKDTAQFTTGLLKEGWSNAKWIAPSNTCEDDGIAPMLRRDFTVSKQLAKAYAYATACGSYELYINGEQCGDNYLNPGCFSYNDSVLYQTYDITSMLNSGSNAVGTIIGNGWFNFSGAVHDYGKNICFYGKIKLIYTDGTTETIVTDTSWKSTTEGPIRENDYYFGETYDATREMPGWNKPGFDAGSWLSVKTFDPTTIINDSYILGTVISETANISPVKSIGIISAQSVAQAQNGNYIYVFGQNMAGILSINVSAPKGAVMTVKVGETLNADGQPDQNLFEGRAPTYSFTSCGKAQTFTAALNYCGMQYLEVSGVGKMDLSDVKLILLSSVAETCSFQCSDELFNKYYNAEMNSLKSNFMSNITDCPTREKNGWTGDAHITSKTAGYMVNSYYSYDNFMRMMREAQLADGTTAFILPARNKNNYQAERDTLASGWCDSVVIIPWQIYNQYGNISIIQDNYSAMCKWVDYLNSSCSGNGYIRSEGEHYGDHMNYNQYTIYEIIGTAYSAYSADLLSKMAEVLGKTEDAQKYRNIYQCFRSAWKSNFVSSDGNTLKADTKVIDNITYKTQTQTAYAMGLYFGLFDEQKKYAAAQNLADLMHSDGYQTCGYVGIGLLYDVLSDNGQGDTAFEFFHKTGTPSLLDHIATGSSNIWETYLGGSHNHHVLGAPAQWLISKIVGIDNGTTGGGYENFVLKPTFGDLTNASATFKSARGLISSKWSLTGQTGYTYTCTVPINTTATLYLPLGSNATASITEDGKDALSVKGLTFLKNENSCAVFQVKSGTYNFAVAYN